MFLSRFSKFRASHPQAVAHVTSWRCGHLPSQCYPQMARQSLAGKIFSCPVVLARQIVMIYFLRILSPGLLCYGYFLRPPFFFSPRPLSQLRAVLSRQGYNPFFVPHSVPAFIIASPSVDQFSQIATYSSLGLVKANPPLFPSQL